MLRVYKYDKHRCEPFHPVNSETYDTILSTVKTWSSPSLSSWHLLLTWAGGRRGCRSSVNDLLPSDIDLTLPVDTSPPHHRLAMQQFVQNSRQTNRPTWSQRKAPQQSNLSQLRSQISPPIVRKGASGVKCY